MTDSRDRGISQSLFENSGPYIPIRTAHTDCLIRTDIITEVNSFTGSATTEENICSLISYVLVLYSYSLQSYDKRFINRVCLCHTEKYRTLVFQHSPRKLGLYEDHGPVFLSMALASG